MKKNILSPAGLEIFPANYQPPTKSNQMKTKSMKTKILMSLMAVMLLLAPAACDNKKAGKTGGKTKASAKAAATAAAQAAVPAVLYGAAINPNDVFAVGRNGDKVLIQWIIDLSSCASIKIYRNGTGTMKDRSMVAFLPGKSKEFADTLPDAGAYWYWLNVRLPDGKLVNVGPLRVPPDQKNAGNYTAVSYDIHFTARRNGASVTIKWDMPDIKYKSIRIKRNSRPRFDNRATNRQNILETLEWKGSLTDTLPDTEGDFWYFIEAIRDDGTVLTKGPVKAGY